MKIKVKKNPTPDQLEADGVFNWPIWTKQASSFPWHYDATEHCYFLEGEVIVTPKNGNPVNMGKGDFVTFPKGMSCHWKIKKPVRKHYTFE